MNLNWIENGIIRINLQIEIGILGKFLQVLSIEGSGEIFENRAIYGGCCRSFGINLMREELKSFKKFI